MVGLVDCKYIPEVPSIIEKRRLRSKKNACRVQRPITVWSGVIRSTPDSDSSVFSRTQHSQHVTWLCQKRRVGEGENTKSCTNMIARKMQTACDPSSFSHSNRLENTSLRG